MKKTNKTNCESDFPQEAIDAWAAVYIDVADKLDQEEETNAKLCSLPTPYEMEEYKNLKPES